MHDVARRCDMNYVRSKDAQKQLARTSLRTFALMPNSLYGARLQGFTVVVFIVAKSRAWFDEYIYHDSLQARAIEGIGHCLCASLLRT